MMSYDFYNPNKVSLVTNKYQSDRPVCRQHSVTNEEIKNLGFPSARYFCEAWMAGNSNRPEPWHDVRYAKSFDFLMRMLLPNERQTVLEIGGRSTFTDFLEYAWNESTLMNTGNGDVRFPNAYNPLAGSSVDLVLMMEVIEHLHDIWGDTEYPAHQTEQGEEYHSKMRRMYEARAQWEGSGQFYGLVCAIEKLRVGGFIFITTPNVCGYRAIANVLHEEHPYTYQPHVRELTRKQLIELVTRTGKLQVIECGELLVWNHHGLSCTMQQQVRNLLQILDVETDRGDCIYLLAKKVSV